VVSRKQQGEEREFAKPKGKRTTGSRKSSRGVKSNKGSKKRSSLHHWKGNEQHTLAEDGGHTEVYKKNQFEEGKGGCISKHRMRERGEKWGISKGLSEDM